MRRQWLPYSSINVNQRLLTFKTIKSRQITSKNVVVIKNNIIVVHASIFELKDNFENEQMKHNIKTQFSQKYSSNK